jgi:hypothetical protein
MTFGHLFPHLPGSRANPCQRPADGSCRAHSRRVLRARARLRMLSRVIVASGGITACSPSPCLLFGDTANSDDSLSTLTPERSMLETAAPRRCGDADPPPGAVCRAGKTGPGCALTCDRSAGAACGYAEYCDSEGRVAGLSGRRASLFRTTPESAAEQFVKFVTMNPSAFGLRRDIERTAIAFTVFATGEHGPLFVVRLAQEYRGLPLLGPERFIVLSGRSGEVTLMNGTVVDAGITYANLDTQCSPEVAMDALRRHAANSVEQASQIELSGLRLYALARARRIVWGAHASLNGAHIGMFAVDASPTVGSTPPTLLYADRGAYPGLEDEVKIEALSVDLSASPYVPNEELATVINEKLATGPFLMGSTVAGGIQLGSPRVFMRDLDGQTIADGLTASTRTVSPDGVFLAASGPELASQRIYHLYQSFYEITDRYLTVPDAPDLRQWDSHLGDASSFEPGTYQPRVAVFTSSGEKCLSQPACAGAYIVDDQVPPELPEFSHVAANGKLLESIGYTHFKNNDVGVNVVAHEFGHVADVFLSPGVAEGTPCTPGVDCIAKCVEDTPDEAPPLREAVAQLLALLYWYEASPEIDDQDCFAVDWITHNGTNAETPGPCMAELGQVAYMVRDGDCPVFDTGYCDKPEAIGFTTICCDTQTDPDCLQMDATCIGKGGGSKLVPTGACSPSPGYRSNSTLEAFWQLLIGKACAPTAPFTCVPIVIPGEVSPSEAAARALFYALRVDSNTFRQLFDNIAAYYSCEYGADAYDGVRAAFCGHRIMDCSALPPLVCGECGNAIVEAGEQCDLTSIPVGCTDLGYAGGEMSCSSTCELREDGCSENVPTSAAPTETAEDGAGASSASETDTEGASDSGGCGCRQAGGPTPWIPLSLGLAGLALHPRQRRSL